ncbi:hypothetical protein BU15DRAFT_76446 [Melanogaster broomeanus]|nr:hypothetical protein BU15DRAFT_76446 [Melanogaster broomeanus]
MLSHSTGNQGAVSTRAAERITGQITLRPVPVAAHSIMRYNRKVRVWPSESRYPIYPGTKEFIDKQRCSLGEWEPCTHPEGALYFRHPHRRICTDANLWKQDHLDAINLCADLLSDLVETTLGVEFSEESELVLELMDDKIGSDFGYYFVDHKYQCLFWVHPFEAEPMFGNIKGVKSPSHIKYAMEAQYWLAALRHWYERLHCELFPTQPVLRPFWEEVKLTLVHATAETITSDASLAPFNGEELGKMLELTKDLEGSIGHHHPYAMVVLARFARMFGKTSREVIISSETGKARTKFFSFCGQPGARLDVDQSVYDNNGNLRQSVFLRCISPFLFGAPVIHAHGLKTIWIDKLVNHVSWKRFINKLNSEWQEFTLYGTVVLNANVAFLALTNLTPAARTSSNNRSKSRDSAEEAVYFMTRITSSMFGTETLAVLYSTPFSFLMWGMIFFVIAFCLQVFQGSDPTTQASVGFAVAVVGSLVFWTVWSAWDRTPPEDRHAGTLEVTKV